MDFSKKATELRRAIRQFMNVYQKPHNTSKFDDFVGQLNAIDERLKNEISKPPVGNTTSEEWDGNLEPKEGDNTTLQEIKKFLVYLQKEEEGISQRLEKAQTELANVASVLLEEGESLLKKVFN